MPQLRGNCGHKKAKWDNHPSCLSCSNCTVDNKCDICISWSEDTWYSAIRRRAYSSRSSRMPRKQDESQRQASKASKKSAIDDASSHHDSGAEEALSVRADDVVSNARSDKRHSDRVDDVVSNARSDNRQKGVIPLDTGLENVPSPGSQPPDDSSTGLRELPGVSSRDDRARHPSSEENTRSGNYSSQRIDYRSSPVRSFSHESGVPGTRSGRVQTSGLRHSAGGVSFSRSGRGRNNQRDKRSRSKSSSFFDSDESSSARYHSVSSSSRSRSRDRSRRYSRKKKSHRHRSHSRDSYRRKHKRRSRSRSHNDRRSRHRQARGRRLSRSRDKRHRSSRSPYLQEKRRRISHSPSSDKNVVPDVVSGSITDNEFEGESVASPIQKSVTTSSYRVKDKSSTHRPSESCSVYSEEEDDGKISYAETIEEVFNLLPTSICPRKNDPSIPSKPRSGIDLLNPTEDKESSSLPQSQLIKDILNLVQTYVSDKVKLEPGWTAPVNLERELGTHMKFYKLHNEQFPASIPKVDKDASKLDLSTTGSINVSSKFLESMERQARNVISINSYADLFATSAFSTMQSDDMDTNMLRRLVQALVNCLKHSTNLSFLMAVELMLARRELAISGSKILTESSKDSLRSIPFSVNSLFGGKISEIQKANSETHQQKLIADSVSQKPGSSQSSQFRTPRVPRKKQDSKTDLPRPTRQPQAGRGGSRTFRGRGSMRRDRNVPSRGGASSDRRH